eukprot:6016678-Amphidinium_carterae.2
MAIDFEQPCPWAGSSLMIKRLQSALTHLQTWATSTCIVESELAEWCASQFGAVYVSCTVRNSTLAALSLGHLFHPDFL